MKIEVLSPAGSAGDKQPFAARVASLAGKKIGVLSNGKWQAHRTLPLVLEKLRGRYPGSEFISIGEGMQIAEDASIEFVAAQGCEAVVIGNAA